MEKKVFRGFALSGAILIGVFLLLHAAVEFVWADDYSDMLTYMTRDVPEDAALTIVADDPEVLNVQSAEFTEEGVELSAQGLEAGEVTLTVVDEETGEVYADYEFTVTESGRVVNEVNGNFSAMRAHLVLTVFSCAGLAFILWLAFHRARKVLRYSYQCVFYCGFAIWATAVALYTLYLLVKGADAYSIYAELRDACSNFILFSSPILTVFFLALCASNISLIRHEGFKTRNALGIILSGIALAAMAVGILLGLLPLSGSEARVRFYDLLIESYSAVFVMGECFLTGAVICGTLAARHTPPFDRDYVIILGCKFRKDGTLYPLIRGRVDRAIGFYRAQLKKTGRVPKLIPSGGQGSDEPMPEAEAMKRYMLEQGIPEADILPESRSRTTAENMKFSYELIKPKAKVAYSTTNYHVFRSGVISRQNGFTPDGMGSPTKWYFWPNAYVRELLGMVVYMRRTLILITIPLVAVFVALQYMI